MEDFEHIFKEPSNQNNVATANYTSGMWCMGANPQR